MHAEGKLAKLAKELCGKVGDALVFVIYVIVVKVRVVVHLAQEPIYRSRNNFVLVRDSENNNQQLVRLLQSLG